MNNDAIVVAAGGGVDIDIAMLAVGDYIEPSSLEAIFGFKRADPRYGLKALSLAKLIERKSSAAGAPMQCRGDCYGIRVMTPIEQLEYNWESFLSSLRRMDRAEEWLRKIDSSGFSDESARLKIDREQKMAGVTQALASPRKKLMLSFGDEPRRLVAE